MKIIGIGQGSEEWFEMRRNKISATDAATIMEINPYETPLQLWSRKITGERKESNSAMERGTRLEPKARQWAENILQVDLLPLVVQSSEFDWAIASLDGFCEHTKTLVEIKCPGEKNHQEAKNGRIAKNYIAQMQHQMMCTDTPRCHYISFDGEDGVIIIVNRDDDFIKEMIKKELEFLYMLRDFVAPEISEKDYIHRPDQEWSKASILWIDAKKRLKASEEEEKQCRDELIRLSAGLNCQGSNVKIQKVIRKGTVDFACIPVLQDIDLNQYRKPPIETWRITENER